MMNMWRASLAGTFLVGSIMGVAVIAQVPTASRPAPEPAVLSREQAAAFIPATVFYRGQTAAIQGRNSSGVRLAGGKLILAAIVDTSGYSSGIAETYQAYLITEVPLQMGDRTLLPGTYGFGFVAAGAIVVMDVGGNEILRTSSQHDATMARPTPLQFLANGEGYRLYLGRNYVTITISTQSR